MDRPRFHCPDLIASHQGPILLSAEEGHHATRVLRLTRGAPVELFSGDGVTAEGVLAKVDRASAVVEVSQVIAHAAPANRRLTLVTALPRAHRQQFLFEKATELGVAAIHPLVAARSTVKAHDGSAPKWRRYCIEAAKQCGAAYLPRVGKTITPATFEESLCGFCAAGACWIADPAEQHLTLPGALAQPAAAASVAVCIGPEGGFAPGELDAARAAGFRSIGLGAQVLRVETAALVVAAIVALSRA